MKKTKYYVVFKGYKTGIFDNWDDCKKQVSGFSGALHKSFDSEEEAKNAFNEYNSIQNDNNNPVPLSPYSVKCLIVSGNCPNNFGEMSYLRKLSATNNIVSEREFAAIGTKNIAEFLVIVETIKLSKKVKRNLPIYTSSQTALNWIRNKKCKHQIFASKKTEKVFSLIREAEDWLVNNTVENEIILWNTSAWGKFPLGGRRRTRRQKINDGRYPN